MKKLLFGFCIFLLAVNPLYRNCFYGLGFSQYKRHTLWKQGESPFFNPWQYRVLSPLLVEAGYQIYTNTIGAVLPVEDFMPSGGSIITQLNPYYQQKIKEAGGVEVVINSSVRRYLIIFSLFRILQHLLIFYLFWRYAKRFTPDKYWLAASLVFISLLMGNAVRDSDLSFNTYTDIIIYLAAAILVLEKWQPAWLVLLAAIGSMNRETAIFVPAIYFVAQCDWQQKKLPEFAVFKWTTLAYVAFGAVFVGIRTYYGAYPAYLSDNQVAVAGLPLLIDNLTSFFSVYTYGEATGSYAVPLIASLYCLRRSTVLLQNIFVLIVPAWFLMHFLYSFAYETRTFLVPILLIFMPIILNEIKQKTMDSKADLVF